MLLHVIVLPGLAIGAEAPDWPANTSGIHHGNEQTVVVVNKKDARPDVECKTCQLFVSSGSGYRGLKLDRLRDAEGVTQLPDGSVLVVDERRGRVLQYTLGESDKAQLVRNWKTGIRNSLKPNQGIEGIEVLPVAAADASRVARVALAVQLDGSIRVHDLTWDPNEKRKRRKSADLGTSVVDDSRCCRPEVAGLAWVEEERVLVSWHNGHHDEINDYNVWTVDEASGALSHVARVATGLEGNLEGITTSPCIGEGRASTLTDDRRTGAGAVRDVVLPCR